MGGGKGGRVGKNGIEAFNLKSFLFLIPNIIPNILFSSKSKLHHLSTSYQITMRNNFLVYHYIYLILCMNLFHPASISINIFRIID